MLKKKLYQGCFYFKKKFFFCTDGQWTQALHIVNQLPAPELHLQLRDASLLQ